MNVVTHLFLNLSQYLCTCKPVTSMCYSGDAKVDKFKIITYDKDKIFFKSLY